MDRNELISTIASAIIGGFFGRASKKSPAPADPPAQIPLVHPGDDPWKALNIVIGALNGEQLERAEDRKKFQKWYTDLGHELNTERNERLHLKTLWEKEQFERRKLETDLAREVKDREELDARITTLQKELTIAQSNNELLKRDNQVLTDDNRDLRKVNSELLSLNQDLRKVNQAQVERIDQLVEELTEVREELDRHMKLIRQNLNGGEDVA